MEYEIASKCAKGFSLRRMKVKPNASVSKETFDTLADIFQGIFTVDPNERMGIEELQKYIFLQPEKALIVSSSTESESGEEEGVVFEREKLAFVEEVLQEVKQIGFLSSWEEACF